MKKKFTPEKACHEFHESHGILFAHCRSMSNEVSSNQKRVIPWTVTPFVPLPLG